MLGEPLLRLDECDSTNRVALDWADAPHGACVVARAQSSGRGRLGRRWESARGKGLYFSLVLRPEKLADAALYSPLTVLSLTSVLEAVSGLSLAVKWPNDLICVSKHGEARKLGGILCETRGERLVVGIGINLNQEVPDLPDRPIFPATSLHLESGALFDLERVLGLILGKLNEDFAHFENSGWSLFAGKYARKCLGIGEVVRVRTERESLIGVFEGVGDDGALLLKTAGGLRRILAGDVAYF